ncbi:MAG: hypothetical protein RLY93_13155 [Sumerlaeia bacterium]
MPPYDPQAAQRANVHSSPPEGPGGGSPYDDPTGFLNRQGLLAELEAMVLEANDRNESVVAIAILVECPTRPAFDRRRDGTSRLLDHASLEVMMAAPAGFLVGRLGQHEFAIAGRVRDSKAANEALVRLRQRLAPRPGTPESELVTFASAAAMTCALPTKTAEALLAQAGTLLKEQLRARG